MFRGLLEGIKSGKLFHHLPCWQNKYARRDLYWYFVIVPENGHLDLRVVGRGGKEWWGVVGMGWGGGGHAFGVLYNTLSLLLLGVFTQVFEITNI